MSIFDDNNYIEITQEDISDALQSSNHLDSRIQKRAFANVLGARLGIKLFNTLEVKADNFNSMYTIPSILKDMDISDIRTTNNITADIRLVQDENHLCIPKSHYDFNVTPDIYVFIRITPDFSAAALIGAIAPDEIDKSVELDGYYFISKDTLYNETSLKKVLLAGKPASNVHPSENEIVRGQSMIVNFIDGDVINSEKHYIYEILRQSDELKQFFKDFEHFELISTDLAHTEEILSDSVLDVLGAQEIYKDEDYNEGFASQIDLDELAAETAADFVEDFIDDSKEAEMPYNNDIIEGEFEELPDDAQVEEPGELEELPTDEELAGFAEKFEETSFDDEPEPLEMLNSDNSTFEGFEGLDVQNTDITQLAPLDTETLEMFSESDINTNDILTSNDNANNIQEDISNNDNNIDLSEFLQQDNTDLTESSVNALSNIDNLDVLDEFSAPDLQDNVDNIEEVSTETNINDELSSGLEQYKDVSVDEFDINSAEVQESTGDDFVQENETIEPVSFDEVLSNENFDISSDDTIAENDMVQDEALELQEIEKVGSLEDLEKFELPVNMDLPALEYDENLDKLNENNLELEQDTQVEEISETEELPQTLDEISQNVTFDEQGNIEEISQSDEIQETLQESIENNIQNEEIQEENTINQSTLDDNDDMSGLEEFTVDMAAAYEKANPQAFSNINNSNYDSPQQEQVMPEFNEADFKLTDDLPKLDNLEPVNLDEQNPVLEENSQSENTLINDSVEMLEPAIQNNELAELPELDALYEVEDLQPDNINEFSSMQIDNFQEDTPTATEQEATTQAESQQEDYLNNSFTEMEVYRPESDSTADMTVESFEAPLQEEFNADDYSQTSEVEGFNLDELSAQQNDESSAYSDINLDDLDSDDDEFGDFNYTDTADNNYSNANNLDIDNINIDDIDIDNIDINNIDINNIDMSEFDVNNLSAIEDIPDATQQAPEVEFVQNDAPNGEYVPDFNQNDENTINSLYDENTNTQNPGEAINQSFDQNNVGPQQQKPKKSKGQQKTSPILGILLIVLIIAFGFMKKDLILEKLNAQKGVNYEQDQNMPVEGETQEDIENAKLLNEEGNNPQDENQGQEQMPVGDIPGEAGGPQDAADMEKSLHQKGSMANDIPGVKQEQLPTSTPMPITTNTIKRLYWEIPQDLTYNDSIVYYLKTVGKTMKFAIQSDLLNITEMPYSNKTIVEVEIKKDGSVGDVNTSVSSGSKQIDTIVLQSVKAALKYVKAPTSEFKQDSYRFSLIINF